ncbi:MAG: tyrosine-type recombinase/integrase [Gammaproteobacteria bacterium]
MAPRKQTLPTPLFDTQDNLAAQQLPETIALPFAHQDFHIVKDFLLQYTGSRDTYTAYRRETERLVQWSWFVAKKSLLVLRRPDIEAYILFCQHPPNAWIGAKKVARFINRAGERIPNPDWRLFVVTTKQSAAKESSKPDSPHYQFSQKALQSLFISVSSFYNYLIREGIHEINPVSQIRQKSRFTRKQQQHRHIRRLTSLQWSFVIETAEKMANEDHDKYERTLFILSALYLMYLRISELATTPRWEPQMGNFYQDSYDNWWFKTVGKGNKERDITVSNAMLKALARYRRHRGLTPALPLPGETTPLIHKRIGQGGIESTRHIRLLVQECFDKAITSMKKEGFIEEANALAEATVHWLRHTGISDDLNKRGRPMVHVRDDAGHTTSATTDLYNDAELQKRHASGKKKTILPD